MEIPYEKIVREGFAQKGGGVKLELVLKYVLARQRRRREEIRERYLANVHELWLPLHESEEHKVSVFAGRLTGKTYNIALKAAMSEHNCIVYTSSRVNVNMIMELIMSFETEFDPIDDATSSFIAYHSGRTVDVEILPHTKELMRGINWTNKVILIDEFDCDRFEGIMNIMSSQILRARQIICVGSITMPGDSFAKRWFKDSDLNFFVDSSYVSNSHSISSFMPSIASQMID